MIPNWLRRFAPSTRLSAPLMVSLVLAACGGAPATTPSTQQATSAPASAASTAEAPAGSAATTAPADTTTTSAASGILVASDTPQTTFVRNFNPFSANNRWPTQAGIYEPLIIYNRMTGKVEPWLATDYTWSADNKTLTFTTRENVKWSDGQPFSAKDVAYTFNLMKAHKELTGAAASAWTYLSDVQAPDDKTAVFTFSSVYTPGLYDIGQQMIVPEHVWSTIADPVKDTNDTPVGTGPFTEVAVFQDQVWELHKNPNYWQPGKPYIEGIRIPAYAGADQITLALTKGEIDWAGNFIPDIEKTYVAGDPANNKYWFPSTGDTVQLYLNTTKKPFDDPNVRKAISMALNREQITKVAEYNYTHPADVTGLSDAYANWRDATSADTDWIKFDAAKANELLDAAGLKKGGDGVRVGADGKPLVYDINVVSGWNDWVSACQIMAQNLKQVGITAAVKTYDFSAWFDKVQKGDFDMSIGWSSGGATPFNFYRGAMSSQTVKPVGEAASENWHRYASPDADKLLDQFAATSDAAQQTQIANQLQQLYAANAPAIPLFPGPQWYEYSTKRFTGWPSAENPYALPSTYATPERLITLTTIKPK